MTVKKQRAVPVCRDIDDVGCEVGQSAGDVLLRRCASAKQGNHNRGERGEQNRLRWVRHRDLPLGRVKSLVPSWVQRLATGDSLCRARELVNAKKRRFLVLGAPAALPA